MQYLSQQPEPKVCDTPKPTKVQTKKFLKAKKLILRRAKIMVQIWP